MSIDNVYQTFADNLKAAVESAVADGIHVSANNRNCFCPLGCVEYKAFSMERPTGADARSRADWISVTPSFAPTAFADGFDGRPDCYQGDEARRYYLLGQAYRELYP